MSSFPEVDENIGENTRSHTDKEEERKKEVHLGGQANGSAVEEGASSVSVFMSLARGATALESSGQQASVSANNNDNISDSALHPPSNLTAIGDDDNVPAAAQGSSSAGPKNVANYFNSKQSPGLPPRSPQLANSKNTHTMNNNTNDNDNDNDNDNNNIAVVSNGSSNGIDSTNSRAKEPSSSPDMVVPPLESLPASAVTLHANRQPTVMAISKSSNNTKDATSPSFHPTAATTLTGAHSSQRHARIVAGGGEATHGTPQLKAAFVVGGGSASNNLTHTTTTTVLNQQRQHASPPLGAIPGQLFSVGSLPTDIIGGGGAGSFTNNNNNNASFIGLGVSAGGGGSRSSQAGGTTCTTSTLLNAVLNRERPNGANNPITGVSSASYQQRGAFSLSNAPSPHPNPLQQLQSISNRQTPSLSMQQQYSSAYHHRVGDAGELGDGDDNHVHNERAPLAGGRGGAIGSIAGERAGGGGGGLLGGSFAAMPIMGGADGGDFNFGLSFGGGATRAHAAATVALKRRASTTTTTPSIAVGCSNNLRNTAFAADAGLYDDIGVVGTTDVSLPPEKSTFNDVEMQQIIQKGDKRAGPMKEANEEDSSSGVPPKVEGARDSPQIETQTSVIPPPAQPQSTAPPALLSLEERRRQQREERLLWASTLSPHDPRRWFTMKLPDGLLPEGSIGGSAFNLATNTLGAGTIALPGAFAAAGGVLGLFVLIICLIAAIYAMRLQTVVAEQTGMNSYALKARVLLGPWAERLMAIIVIVLCWGVTVVYVVSIGDLLDTFRLYDGAPLVMQGDWGRRLVVTLFWLITMLPLSLPAQINSLRYASLAGLGATGVLIAALMAFAATAEETVMRPIWTDVAGDGVLVVTGYAPARQLIARVSNIPVAKFDLTAVMALPVFIFGTACHTNTYNVYSELSNRSPRRMTIVAIVTFLSVGLLYLSCGLTGVAIFGESTKGNILSNFNDPLGKWYITVAFIGMAITLTAAFPLCVFPARDAFLQLAFGYGPAEPVPTYVRVPMSGFIAVVSLLLGLFVPGVKIMFGLLGGLLGSSVVYVFPAIFAMRSKSWTPDGVGWGNIIGAWVLLIFGILAALFGTALSIYDLV